MTIAAAYLVSDGIVFGADSSTTVQVTNQQGTGVVQLLTHSQKVFEVGTNSRFGVCTWGAANIGTLSHRTIIARLSEEINDGTTVEEAMVKLLSLVEPLVKAAQIPFVGYNIGGWNPVTHEPACFQIEITPTGNKVTPFELGLCHFSGNPNFFIRTFRGFDPILRDNLLKELKISLPGIGNLDEVFGQAFERASSPLVSSGFPDLPIREAIDFVYSYLHLTVKASKFKFGAPTCGGPIEIGFISTDRKFRWARHKPFYSAMTEQEGEYDLR